MLCAFVLLSLCGESIARLECKVYRQQDRRAAYAPVWLLKFVLTCVLLILYWKGLIALDGYPGSSAMVSQFLHV